MMLQVLVVLTAAASCVWGLHRLVMLVDLWLLRRRPALPPTSSTAPTPGPPPAVPHVTVQLPIFNEPAVVERLIEAACALRWPSLEVQVLDDSTDAGRGDTSARAARAVEAAKARGVDVVHLRRDDRSGFKAGALQAGLQVAKGELIAIFDADFVPAPDFLERAVPRLGDAALLQARWGHHNERENVLTRAQAAFLDGHFGVEHKTRSARGLFFNFNGTAGLWRTQAIVDAGGWESCTLTEDLDLSVRAFCGGARFVYADDLVVPAELPAQVNAWKGQQHRWSKGSLQTARRRLGMLWRSTLPASHKLEATLKLTHNVAYVPLALLVLLLPAAALSRAHASPPLWVQGLELLAFSLGTLPVWLSLAVAQPASTSLPRRFSRATLALAVGCGLAVHNARAVFEGVFEVGERSFVRTPKAGATSGTRPLTAPKRASPVAALELLLGAFHLATALVVLGSGSFSLLPFLLLCGAGLVVVGGQSVLEGARALQPRAHVALLPD